MRATGPEDVTAEVTFDLIIVINCQNKVITLPQTQDQVYKVNDPQVSYEVEAFGNDESVYCPLIYSISYDEQRSWLVKTDERTM